MAKRASSIVAGKYWLRSVATGRWLCSEMPRLQVDQLPQVDEVLLGHRLVEAVLVVEGLDDGRVPKGRLAQVGGGRVTGHEMGEDEGNEGDPDHEDHADPEAPGQEPAEPGGGDPPGSVPVESWPTGRRAAN